MNLDKLMLECEDEKEYEINEGDSDLFSIQLFESPKANTSIHNFETINKVAPTQT